ncbi:MAG: YcjF family protein [Rhodobacteraceae bacterium]|jgi:putative membrane protein|nr:YcjF family protein [Paracoccaceae bacterium]
MGKRPLIVEREGPAEVTPATAPPVPDAGLPEPRAMRAAVALAARRPSRLGRLFRGALTAALGFVVSLAAWNFVTGLLAQNPVLGAVAAGLFGLVLLAALLIVLRELAALSRLARVDRLHREAEAALASGEAGRARAVAGRLSALYAGRPELAQGRERLAARVAEQFDADAVFALAEAELLAPLDAQARIEIEGAARMVATVTALVPVALADVAAALTANIRMIRRIAEIYGGRAGLLGSLRLARSVVTHLVATGAVAVGDDLIGSVAGGGMLAKVSRRFGEGVVNGALTARVGIAAMEVCRPLPFRTLPRPRVTNVLQRALTGLFGSGRDEAAGG